MRRYMKKLRRNAKGQSAKLRRCYVYEIRVDGVVRYIGKGCKDRIYYHLIEAKRTAGRPGVKIRNLSPHFRKMLVSAVRRGAIITEDNKLHAHSRRGLCNGVASDLGLPQAARWAAVEHNRRTRQKSRGFAQ